MVILLKKIRLNLRPAALCLLFPHRYQNFLLPNLLKSRYKTRVNSCSARILNKYSLVNMELGNPSRTLQFMQIMLNPLPSCVLILVIYEVFYYFPHTTNDVSTYKQNFLSHPSGFPTNTTTTKSL